LGKYQESGYLSSEPVDTMRRSGRGSVSLAGIGPGAGALQGSEGLLGNTTKLLNPPQADFHTLRVERYALQSAARSSLPGERVGMCLRMIRPQFNIVNVLKTIKRETFHYGNLAVCGSVWTCPVCASKITEHRRLELVQGMETFKSRGGGVQLLTLTVPHYANQKLKTVLDGIGRAFFLMKNRKPWKRMCKALMIIGDIKATEVTYGENGWHPHFHILLFTGLPLTKGSFKSLHESILDMWQKACVTAGLPKPNEHGVSIGDGSKSASYASKWGLEHEMTKGHVKKGKVDGKTPFDLLRSFIETEDPKWQKLFQEYAKCFKGKNQLVWSRGLRGILNLVAEKSDQEIAENVDEESVLFAQLAPEVWKIILRKEKRAQVLAVCKQGIEVFQDYIIQLVESEMEVIT